MVMSNLMTKRKGGSKKKSTSNANKQKYQNNEFYF